LCSREVATRFLESQIWGDLTIVLISITCFELVVLSSLNRLPRQLLVPSHWVGSTRTVTGSLCWLVLVWSDDIPWSQGREVCFDISRMGPDNMAEPETVPVVSTHPLLSPAPVAYLKFGGPLGDLPRAAWARLVRHIITKVKLHEMFPSHPPNPQRNLYHTMLVMKWDVGLWTRRQGPPCPLAFIPCASRVLTSHRPSALPVTFNSALRQRHTLARPSPWAN